MDKNQSIKDTVRKVCKIVNEHIQHNNPYDCSLVLKIKEQFGIEPNEVLEEIPCKTDGQ